MNSSSLDDALLGRVEPQVGRARTVHGDLPGVHLREELLADDRDEQERANSSAAADAAQDQAAVTQGDVQQLLVADDEDERGPPNRSP